MIRITPQTGIIAQVLRVGKTVLSLRAGTVVMSLIQVVGTIIPTQNNWQYEDSSSVSYEDSSSVTYEN